MGCQLGFLAPHSQLGEPDQQHHWLEVCCHVSCSSDVKPTLPTGLAFQGLGCVSQVPPEAFPAGGLGMGSYC